MKENRHCEERSDEAIQGCSTVLVALYRHAAKRRLAMTGFIGTTYLFLVRSVATKQSRGAARAFVLHPWIASPPSGGSQ
jgi:hypothetical protein